jgi:hypothetical protein
MNCSFLLNIFWLSQPQGTETVSNTGVAQWNIKYPWEKCVFLLSPAVGSLEPQCQASSPLSSCSTTPSAVGRYILQDTECFSESHSNAFPTGAAEGKHT